VAGSSIDCGLNCSVHLDAGTAVSLTATPAAGSVFGGWSGPCTGTGSCNFTLDASSTVYATFTQAGPLTLALSPLATGEITVPYDAPLVTGGASAYTITLKRGAYPAGLSADPNTGHLSGTPAGPAKPAHFTIEITDSLGASVTGSFRVKTLNAVEVHTRRLKVGTVGMAYKATLAAGHGMKPYAWALIGGTLPDGLSLDPATGAITGVPTAAGAAPLTVQVTDSLGARAQDDLILTVR
jgi:hypothetical protein